MHFVKVSSLCVVLLVSACQTVRYEYEAPDTADGKQCVVQCASVREMCRSNENQRAQSEKKSCERRSETTYLVCMDKAKGNKDKQAKCDKKRGKCYENQNFSRCNEEYNQCFSYCGGIVKKIIEKN